MSKKIAVLPFLVAVTLTPLPFALDRTDDGRESSTAVDQGTAETLNHSRGGWDHNGPDMSGMVDASQDVRVLYRGGWDRNGPDMSGIVDASQDVRVLYRGGWDGNGPDEHGVLTENSGDPVLYRGGWDYNGPESAGAEPPTNSTNGLDMLVVQAIELPSGDVIGSTKK